MDLDLGSASCLVSYLASLSSGFLISKMGIKSLTSRGTAGKNDEIKPRKLLSQSQGLSTSSIHIQELCIIPALPNFLAMFLHLTLSGSFLNIFKS